MMFAKLLLSFLMVAFSIGTASAHFGLLIPSVAEIESTRQSELHVQLAFCHPFARIGMDMQKPRGFFALVNGEKKDLLPILKENDVFGRKAWEGVLPVKRPDLYMFAVEPEPYWEPAEDCYIAHYVKTVVSAYGEEEGWDQALGLEAEIVPLSRPFGNYAGNLFQGQVLKSGKPVPNAKVEIEFYNRDGEYVPPTGSMATQVIKADANGVFIYAVPFDGWWGFAALLQGDKAMEYDGQEKPVEIGAVLWAKFEPVSRVKKAE